ncbi:MAG: CarD family transcriptional regulator [Pseudomonadota bacterium]
MKRSASVDTDDCIETVNDIANTSGALVSDQAQATQSEKKTVRSSKKKRTVSKKSVDAPVTETGTATLKRKKMNVGQKPRGEKSEPIILPTALRDLAKNPPSANDEVIEPTPEANKAKLDFKLNDFVVYPAHGVGRVVMIEQQIIAGITNELFVIDFDQEKMKLRVPTAKAASVGMRGLSDNATIDKAVELLKGRARIKRTMWSRRAQEYEAKINSGDIISVAEVVRDLYRGSDQPEQSYSERQLFEAALDRLAREVAAVRQSDLSSAINELEQSLLQKMAA